MFKFVHNHFNVNRDWVTHQACSLLQYIKVKTILFIMGSRVIVSWITPDVGFCNCSMFCCTLLCVQSSLCNHLDGEERAGCFALFVFLVSRDYFVALPHDATGFLQFVIGVFPDHIHLL